MRPDEILTDRMSAGRPADAGPMAKKMDPLCPRIRGSLGLTTRKAIRLWDVIGFVLVLEPVRVYEVVGPIIPDLPIKSNRL